MDPVQRNELLMHISVFLFGCTGYLFLLLLGLMRLREAPIRMPQLRPGCWRIGLYLVVSTMFILSPLIPIPRYLSPSQIAKDRAAPVLLVIVGFFFLAYVGWVAYELVVTIRWLLAGRPRPPALPPSNSHSHAPARRHAHVAPPPQMALTHRMRTRLRIGRQQRRHSS